MVSFASIGKCYENGKEVSHVGVPIYVKYGMRWSLRGYLNTIVISALSVSLLERMEKHSGLVLGLGFLYPPTTSQVVFPMAHRRSVFGVCVLRLS